MAKAPSEAKPKQQVSRQQLILLVVLTIVLLTVGVVQFGGLFGKKGAPRTADTTNTADANSQATAASPEQPQTGGMQLPPLTPRDPFRPTLVATRPQPEPSKPVRPEPSSRPRREITGTPSIPPITLPSGQIGLQPAAEPPLEPERPTFTLTGVVQGPHSVAILVDGGGRRRFVKQGDLLEDGWRVVRIQRGAIHLRKGDRQLTVRVGESTATNGGNAP